jgi:hypothetical protein
LAAARYSHQDKIPDIRLIFVKARPVAAMKEGSQHSRIGRAGRGRSAVSHAKDRVMLIIVCRLYDSYVDANRIILALQAVGVPPSETTVISNNSDRWYSAAKDTVLPFQKAVARSKAQGETEAKTEAKTKGKTESMSEGKAEGAALGAAIGATAATAASLVTMLALPGVGAVVGVGWLAALLGSMAVGGVTGGLLGALTNAGVSEEDAQVFVEGVRRGGTLVAARVHQAELPRITALMNQSAVKLEERCDLYRKSGWQSFDPSAVPYTADQVRSERALHAQNRLAGA